ncbi:unnamed protein product [Linum tenue]|uniref:Uncharacterized protein n=1 Tax=Linum tenue TaxID=586396 RepID=A0AAV0GR00_9ROSI|nr:unnamed protein product [Linum tenue]
MDSSRSKFVVVAYDVGLNQCREVPQPAEYGDGNGGGYFLSLGELRNCLCIFANYLGESVHAWMMKEYGVESSWTKLFSVPNSGLSYHFSLVPLGLSMNGDEVLLHLDGERLVWLEMEKGKGAQEITILGWEGGDFGAAVCFASLVPPDGKLPPKEVIVSKKKQKEVVAEEEEENCYDHEYYVCILT